MQEYNYAKLIYMIPLEKTFTFYVIILIKSFFNKDKNNYYYHIILEKCSYT